jgi:hypothetical protein
MCEKCDRTLELLKQTKGLNSGDFTYVEFEFPYGEARLVYTNSHDTDNNTSTYTGVGSQIPDALSRAPGA